MVFGGERSGMDEGRVEVERWGREAIKSKLGQIGFEQGLEKNDIESLWDR